MYIQNGLFSVNYLFHTRQLISFLFSSKLKNLSVNSRLLYINKKNYIKYHAGEPINRQQVLKYGVFPGPYFPVFSINTEKYGPDKPPCLDTFYAVNG